MSLSAEGIANVGKIMEEKLKAFIKSYGELNAKKEILNKIMEISSDKRDAAEYAELQVKIQLIESCLQMLPKDERKIVSLHLIENLKWSEVAEQYEKQVGAECNYSERSFKRIQKNALHRIKDFICKNQWENYIE